MDDALSNLECINCFKGRMRNLAELELEVRRKAEHERLLKPEPFVPPIFPREDSSIGYSVPSWMVTGG